VSKEYIHVRPDLADTAALAAEGTANPAAFAVGGIWITADGAAHLVKANDGTTITWGVITVV
jgi:hypothetical protein